jgi:hypothetical protein
MNELAVEACAVPGLRFDTCQSRQGPQGAVARDGPQEPTELGCPDKNESAFLLTSGRDRFASRNCLESADAQ